MSRSFRPTSIAHLAPELRDWLLDSPALTAVSDLVLDAGSCGLIDLRHALAAAVAVEARLRTLGYPGPRRFLGATIHRWPKLHRAPPRVHIDGGVAVLAGVIAEGGAFVGQAGGQGILHLPTTLPETLVAALPGRSLASLVTSPLLDARHRTITSAASTPHGVEVGFDAAAIPIVRIRPALAALSRGPAAPAGPGPARSR